MASLSQVVITLITLLSPLSAHSDSLNNILFNGAYEFIDLSHPFGNGTIYWPTSKKFQFTNKIENNDNSWYAANDFAAGEHGGTHIDAPYHFSRFGKYVGDLSLDKLIVPLIIADVSSKVGDNPDFVLHKSDLDFMINDNMGKPCLLIFKFGWSKYYNDRNKYLGTNSQTNTLRFPGLSVEVAQWITSTYKNIVGIGVDVASVDPGSSTEFLVHKIFAEAGLYNIENVNLERPIHEYKCTALVLPMKIEVGTGAPARVVAVCPKEVPTTMADSK